MGMSQVRKLAAAVLATIVLLGLAAAPAWAEELAHGRTRLILSPKFVSFLEEHRINLTGVNSAKREGRVLVFRAAAGTLDVVSARGTISHNGALRLGSRGHSLLLRSLWLDTERGSVEFESSRRFLRFASATGISHYRIGFGDLIRIGQLRLSEAGATLLNQELRRPGLFAPGMLLGSSRSRFRPSWVGITHGTLRFALEPGAFAKLATVGVRPLPFEADVIRTDPTVYRSSVIRGRIYPGGYGAFAAVESGLRFDRQSPWTELVWTELGIASEFDHTGAPPILNTSSGTVQFGYVPLATANLSQGVRTIDPAARTFSIVGVPVLLETGAANLINRTFSSPERPAVYPGERLGTFSLQMQGR
jgi:hypothetical protein